MYFQYTVQYIYMVDKDRENIGGEGRSREGEEREGEDGNLPPPDNFLISSSVTMVTSSSSYLNH